MKTSTKILDHLTSVKCGSTANKCQKSFSTKNMTKIFSITKPEQTSRNTPMQPCLYVLFKYAEHNLDYFVEENCLESILTPQKNRILSFRSRR